MNKVKRFFSKTSRKVLASTLVLGFVLQSFAPIISVRAVSVDTNEYGILQFNNCGDITNNNSSVLLTYGDGNFLTVSGGSKNFVTEYDSEQFICYLYNNGSVSITDSSTGVHKDENIRLVVNGTGENTPYSYTLNAGSSPIIIDAEFDGGNSGGAKYIEGGIKVEGNFTYSNSGDGDPVDIWLNGTEIGVGEAPAPTKEYYYVESDGTVTFDLATFSTINRITSIKVNNVDYSSLLPKTPAGWLEVNNNQIDMISVTVPYADTYNIVTTTTRNFESSIGNFLWSYLDKDAGTDDYIGNGKLDFVSLVFNGKTYNSLNELKAENKEYLYFNEDALKEGGAVLPTGSELTVKLIPNAGYQLTSFTINGGEFEAGEKIGEYTFTVPSGNFHLGAHFTKVDDAVNSEDSEIIKAGSITLSENEKSMENGTARLDVSDIELNENQISNFVSAAGDYTITNYLDISLYNTIYKGTKTDTWDTKVTELGSNAIITLTLEDGVDYSDVVIVHEKHDGTYEVIPTTYDSTTNTISFVTSSFSNYAIATKNSTIATSDEKVSVKFDSLDVAGYTLKVETVKISEELANKNVKAIFDINVLKDSQVVKIDNEKVNVTIKLDEELLGYDNYKVVYIKDGKIEEEISASVSDGYLTFATTHFSEYGIVATKTVATPSTGDNILLYVSLFAISGVSLIATSVLKKKKVK